MAEGGAPSADAAVVRLAAIDIGSSAARITIATGHRDGSWQPLWQHRYPVRLGQDAFRGSSSAIEAACEAELIAAARAMQGKLVQCGVGHCRAIATAAMREASNGQAVADRVSAALGWRLEIIDGATEAALARRALSEALRQGGRLLPADALLLDLGGGSTELTTLQGGDSISLPLGTVRLLKLEPTLNQALGHAAIVGARARIDALVQKAVAGCAWLSAPKSFAGRVVGSGGNLQALARATPEGMADGERAAAPAIVVDALEALTQPVASLTVAERAHQYRLPKERADLFLPALLLIASLSATLGISRIEVPGTGLREALLGELAERTRGSSTKKPCAF